MTRTRVATYRRDVGASIARVWENVLDWAHLPWLHRGTFASVDPVASGAWGWRARVVLCDAAPGDAPLEIEVGIDRAVGEYHTRTLAGTGTGTDIHTRLEAIGPDRTRVVVHFDVPEVLAEAVPALGDAYRALYGRLWDEDEAMMRARQALLDGRVSAAPRRVRVDGRQYRFRPICPHLGGPLGDQPVDACGRITCPWHGYRFDVRTGRSADGRGLVLDGWEETSPCP